MSYYLGLEVKQTEKDIFISQERYIKEILKFNMFCNLINTPKESGKKLWKFDDREKVDYVQKSHGKFEVLDLYKASYALCNCNSKSLHYS